jgi:hypothetical protein
MVAGFAVVIEVQRVVEFDRGTLLIGAAGRRQGDDAHGDAYLTDTFLALVGADPCAAGHDDYQTQNQKANSVHSRPP